MPRVQRHEPSVSGWRTDEILVGVLQHAVGTALVLAACVLVYTDFNGRAAASALLSGLLVSALTRANQIRFRAVFEQGVALIGAWTVLAPWMLGFVAYDLATWAHVTLGVVAIVSAGAWLKVAREP
ncbi:SPW repeat protein [Methylobacterium sp.]|uniref:SPW repeat protein n=1 Tax=Methylobacterium sp. TaxID=409 RepID=UPI003B02AAB5